MTANNKSINCRPLWLSAFIFLPFLFFIISCAEQGLPGSALQEEISDARWNANSGLLSVSGSAKAQQETVQVYDGDSGSLIGKPKVKDGAWSLQVASAVCSVKVNFGGSEKTQPVSKAPVNCVALGQEPAAELNRALRPAAIKDHPSPLASWPNGAIVSPAQNITIQVGDKLNFAAVAFDPNGNTPISFNWNFSGAAPNTLVQNPGNVTFTKVGTYKIKLIVTNSIGVIDPTPAERIVIVESDVGNNPAAEPPIAQILSPGGDATINVGDSLMFVGNGSGVGVPSPVDLTYLWNFGDAFPSPTPDTLARNPGNLTFNVPGTFVISLNVQNAAGLISVNPDQVTVTVMPSYENMPPESVISSPNSDVTISVGDSLVFSGAGSDPDGNMPLSYQWDFIGGSSGSITSQNPGQVAFPSAGIFNVTLTVIDDLGLADPTPAVRVITVQDRAVDNDPGLTSNHILTPTGNITIDAGESINFTAEAATGHPLATLPLQYHWTFDGAAPDSLELNPGAITFSEAGRYFVKFMVANASGQKVANRVRRVINVVEPNAFRVEITLPNTTMTINLGDSIDFQSVAVDPTDSTANIVYQWVFGKNIPDVMEQNPGLVTFDQPGGYNVTVVAMVVDASGVVTKRVRARVRVKVNDPNDIKGGILEPTTDMMINVGEAVNFVAMGIDVGATGSANYRWEFENDSRGNNVIMPDILEQIPGQVVFDTPGIYEVEYKARGVDLNGAQIKISGERHIMVMDPSATPTPPAPNPTPPAPNPPANAQVTGSILSPGGDMTIPVGGSINFAGTGSDPSGGQLSYLWNFSGATPNTTAQNPGIVTFNQVGTYVVTLIVRNAAGQIDGNPPSVTVTVVAGGGV